MKNEELLALSFRVCQLMGVGYYTSADRGDLYLHQDSKRTRQIAEKLKIKIIDAYGSNGVMCVEDNKNRSIEVYKYFDDFNTREEAIIVGILECSEAILMRNKKEKYEKSNS